MNTIDNKIYNFLNNGISKLHLGCGAKYKNGYINIDFPEEDTVQKRSVKPDIEVDFIKINFPTEKFDEILIHHVFEHFQRHHAVGLLCTFNRILKISGICDIAVPDIFACINIFLKSSYSRKKEMIRHMWGSHEGTWATHHEGWYEDNLIECFKSCGFEIHDILKNGKQWPQIIIKGKKVCKPDIEKINLFFKDYNPENTIINKWMDYIGVIFNENNKYFL